MYLCVCMYVCEWMYMCVCLYVYMCVCVCACMCVGLKEFLFINKYQGFFTLYLPVKFQELF